MSARTRRAPTCPARSPQSNERCALPDTWRAHEDAHGCHESAYVNNSRAVWPARDYQRWLDETGAMVRHLAVLNEAHPKHRKRAVLGCRSCIAPERVEDVHAILRALDLPGLPDDAARVILAVDDLRARGIFPMGGLITGLPAGATFFGEPRPPMPPGLADEIRRLGQRRMERGQ